MTARPSVFAVEDVAAQLAWRDLAPGAHRIEAGPAVVELDHPGGPALVDLDGLPPGSSLDLIVDGRREGSVRTLAPPPGKLLCRVATISDVHLGERAFGYFRTITDVPGVDEPYPLRCLRAALGAAASWGADHLVVKGDLTDRTRADEFDLGGRLLASCGMPVSVVLGNHDTRRRGDDGVAVLARHGIDASFRARCVDLPGIRLVLGSSARAAERGGVLPPDHARELVELAASAPGPAMLLLHHWFQRLPFVTTWPPGLSPKVGRPFLGALADANPRTFVTSGHTHRNRRRAVGPLPLTTVGSTKDWPGAFAGYAVHEGGIRQVVRRIGGRDVLAWMERSRRAVGGMWPLWSTGRRSWRCFSHPWPDHR